jgi:RNA-directed DNA polymerase
MTVWVRLAKVKRTSTGAPPADPSELGTGLTWNHVDRRGCTAAETRIAKATQVGRWNKVQSLQRLLTRSYSGKLSSRQTSDGECKGKRTAGVDGTNLGNPDVQIHCHAQSLTHRGYRPLPLRRVFIPKSNGKERPLGIPTMHDRAMQALWQMALIPVAETTADLNSYGFRPKRSTADAIEQCFCALAKRDSAQWVLEGDIRGCFDNICHEWLLANIPMDKVILRKWLKAGFVDKGASVSDRSGNATRRDSFASAGQHDTGRTGTCGQRSSWADQECTTARESARHPLRG